VSVLSFYVGSTIWTDYSKGLTSFFLMDFKGQGADALRFSLLTLLIQVSLSLSRFAELGKTFNDKLWNDC
jgi:hypothetical protein